MDEWTAGWKVCDRYGGSVYAPGMARIVYRKGEVAVPKEGCGWLAYFAERAMAERFAGMARPARMIVPVAVVERRLRGGEGAFWMAGDVAPIRWGEEGALPVGTRVAEKVYVLEWA